MTCEFIQENGSDAETARRSLGILNGWESVIFVVEDDPEEDELRALVDDVLTRFL